MILILISLIQLTATILTILILVDVILSFFMAPYHPVRQTLEVVVEPLLAPIRRIMPQTGGLDFSPLILLVLVQLIESILIQLLLALS
ncbi:MAG TPA: YggT family protein [Anaerolineales bacterium]